mmetsp:Transcript_15621/g.46109  ORF Transcript_15621/g.46109 Transcript_15621/m.46109 type:complete len:207 (+) Transcript_15621:873-1493(+)
MLASRLRPRPIRSAPPGRRGSRCTWRRAGRATTQASARLRPARLWQPMSPPWSRASIISPAPWRWAGRSPCRARPSFCIRLPEPAASRASRGPSFSSCRAFQLQRRRRGGALPRRARRPWYPRRSTRLARRPRGARRPRPRRPARQQPRRIDPAACRAGRSARGRRKGAGGRTRPFLWRRCWLCGTFLFLRWSCLCCRTRRMRCNL